MWLPRTLLGAQGRAGSPAVLAVPSASQASVRLPVSVPHAAAAEVKQAPADELPKAAAAAHVQRRQQQQHHQGAREGVRRPQNPQGRPQSMPRPPSQGNFKQERRILQQRQQTAPSRAPADCSDVNSARNSAAHRKVDASELVTHPSQQRQAGVLSSQPQQQMQQQQMQRRHLLYDIGSDQDWSLKTGMAVTWLGTSSGSPTKERNISCTLVRVPEAVYMVDVGEGSYRQIRKTGIQLHQVDTIFMTHLHGDHCFGIGSMLISLCNARRRAMQDQQQQLDSHNQQLQQQQQGPDQGPDKLRVVGGPKLGQFVSALLTGAGVARQLDMPVYVTEFVEDDRSAHTWQPLPGCPPGQAYLRCLAPEQLQFKSNNAPAWMRELQHRLDDSGLDWQSHPGNYRPKGLFTAKRGLVWRIPCQHAMVSAAQLQHRIPCWGYVFDEQQQAQHGQQPRSQELQQYPSVRRVVILGDTVDSAAIAPHAYGADVVSHEATFAAGMEGKAALAQHSTAWMAGQFAAAIAANALVLTHFSARYEGSVANDVAGHKGNFGTNMGPGAARYDRLQDRNNNVASAAVEEAKDKAAEERAVKSLSREAEAHYDGQVLLAIDLFTAHVPKREQEGRSE